jgi:transcription initiation factor TFIIB
MAEDETRLSPGEIAVLGQEPVARPWRQNLSVKVICPDCNEDPPNLIDERSSGDLVCMDCGRVLQGNLIDTSSEWRTFTNDDQGNDDPSRVGDAANPFLNGSQLTTEIAYAANDARTRELSRAQKHSNENKNNSVLQEAYKSIGELADASHLPPTVTNLARGLYKQTTDSKQFKGKSQDAMIASLIFIACRQIGVPRSFKEITKLTQVPKKEIGRTFKLLETYFKKQSVKDEQESKHNPMSLANYKASGSTEPKELCGRFASTLRLPQRVGILAGECAEILLHDGFLAGRSPLSVAAVALYAMAALMGHHQTAKEIGAACSVSDGTIRSAWRKIYPLREEFIKKEWLEKGGVMENLPAIA